ncbi:MAG: phosphate starvation-inducible protein PhoH [Gallionellales bacterium GWA2_60_142]|nr:MAG: phosphate starvation-inducible protein PhoH [Gallionellales bacterium GWA2_60_142]
MNAPTIQFALEPLDNQRLANLCGPLDENLRQIEIALEVTISRRSEHFSVQGEQAELAREVLQDFYLEAKNDITLERLQLGLIEAMKWRDDPQPADDFVPLLMTRKSEIRGRTPRQNTYLQAIQEHDITFGIGPAGTGKTYLAVACAVDALQRETVRRLVLVRPAVEAGEKLGFLPGDLAQKVDPYLRPLYDALYDLMGVEKVVKAFDRGMIEIAPLAYMRGRTLNHSFIILDEAQNTTPEQMKMFLTRIGFGSKAVITGDVTQIDLARGQKSGLVEARAVLQDIRGIAFSEFLAEDVVRHPLVQKIVTAYERYEQQKNA